MSASLRRTAPGAPARIVHMGLGAFSRSHIAWYTDRTSDAANWGISAYTGRSRVLADELSTQDGLYTLIERGDDGDTAGVISSITRAQAGEDLQSFLADVASAETAIVSLTVTERGYRLSAEGLHDATDPDVAADDRALRRVIVNGVDPQLVTATTALGRLLLALEHRRRRGSGPLALMSCDNLPDNGGMLRRALMSWATSIDTTFAAWIEQAASFPSSSVDRITPRLDADELAELRVRYGDRAPVVAEPFSDWVIQGDFPAGRPTWEVAGAMFVDALAPWEDRKLWMLNGAHTLLACLGLLRGLDTVAEAIADPGCRAATELFWDEASAHLPAALEPDRYRARLVSRFANPRIEHRLTQIVTDTDLKISLRVVPVALLERAAGRSGAGCAAIFASWIEATKSGLAGSPRDADTASFLRPVSSALAADADFVLSIDEALTAIAAIGDHAAYPHPFMGSNQDRT